jgi:amino acid transporter
MKSTKTLGVFALTMINAAAIINLNNLPSIVVLGYGLLSYLLLAAIFFFLPTAFVSAELATGWPQEGGFYTWVRIAFGPIIGFLAIWLQWIANVIWFPTLIAPIVANSLTLFAPNLSHEPWVMFILMLVIFWILTLINFRGILSSSRISSIGVLLGSLLPAIILISFALIWLDKKFPVELSFHAQDLLPQFNHLSDISILVSILVTLVGMEMSAVHTNNVVEPRKTYPRAILISTVLILATFALTSFAMAILVPPHKIDLINGVLQCLQNFSERMGITWLEKPVMILIIIGILAMASTWILGPSRGLQIAAINSEFPHLFQYKNRHRVPTRILALQAIIYSLLSSLFVFIPSINSSYWILIALTGQLYMLMYFILFCTGLRLRLKYPQVIRAYTVPGKFHLGMAVVCGLGIIGTISAFVVTFFPPGQFINIEGGNYVTVLLILFTIFCILPLILFSIYYYFKVYKVNLQLFEEHSDDILLIEASRLPLDIESVNEAVEELLHEELDHSSKSKV